MASRSTSATGTDEDNKRRSIVNADIDGPSTPLTASESKTPSGLAQFQLDLTKIGPNDCQDRVEFIHETPDKK